jgi:hypothetical protein
MAFAIMEGESEVLYLLVYLYKEEGGIESSSTGSEGAPVLCKTR